MIYYMVNMQPFGQNHSSKPLVEDRLRQPHADWDLYVDEHGELLPDFDQPYVATRAGFRPGANVPDNSMHPSQKMSYLKAELDYVVDGFMRELIDFQAFSNLDSDTQSEIRSRYSQFFE